MSQMTRYCFLKCPTTFPAERKTKVLGTVQNLNVWICSMDKITITLNIFNNLIIFGSLYLIVLQQRLLRHWRSALLYYSLRNISNSATLTLIKYCRVFVYKNKSNLKIIFEVV